MATVTLTYDEQARQLANAHDTILQLQQQISQKDKALADKDKALASCRASYTALRDEYRSYKSYVQGMLANQEISPAAKLTGIALPTVYDAAPERRGKPAIKPGAALADTEEPEPVPMFVGQLSRAIGMSDDSTSKTIQELAESGAVTKEKHHRSDGRTTLSIAPKLALLRNPRIIKPPEGQERNHGGKRVKCPGCGSDAVLEYRKLVCSDCGQVVKEYDPRPVNPAPESEALAPEPVTRAKPEKLPEPQVAVSRKIQVSTSPAKYHETRPTVEECSHPKNLVRRLGEDWYCSECGGRNEELLKYGGAI